MQYLSQCFFIFLLIAAKCSPSVVHEMHDCRAPEGKTAKFKVHFAGNPVPGMAF